VLTGAHVSGDMLGPCEGGGADGTLVIASHMSFALYWWWSGVETRRQIVGLEAEAVGALYCDGWAGIEERRRLRRVLVKSRMLSEQR
jgi:hypothetical protein